MTVIERTLGGHRAVEFDAVGPRSASTTADPHPRVAGRRVTDVTALVSGCCWLGAVGASAGDVLALSTVDLFVALAVLAFVPLGLWLAATPRRTGDVFLPYRLAVYGQLPAALAVVAALALLVGSVASVALALPWLGVTSLVALVGLWRLGSRGLWPLAELSVDAALFYVPVGAVALVLHRAGVSLRFEPMIILLTVVHYHYAGFVLPLVNRRLTGRDGRFGTGPTGRVAAVATLVLVVNLALIAVGITFSPLVEVVAVALFTVAVAAFALLTLWQVVPSLGGPAAGGLAVASLAIVLTMALALGYGYSAFPETGTVIDIGQMIRWHGTLNAFGFALPALLSFRWLDR